MKLQESTKHRPNINITSLIDVLFLLLTFFLVTTSFIEQSALKVELPSMQNSEQVRQEKRFVLNVNSTGEMTYDGSSVTEEALREALSGSASEVDASGGLILRADRSLPYGEVMAVLDLIRGAGVRRFSIASVEGD